MRWGRPWMATLLTVVMIMMMLRSEVKARPQTDTLPQDNPEGVAVDVGVEEESPGNDRQMEQDQEESDQPPALDNDPTASGPPRPGGQGAGTSSGADTIPVENNSNSSNDTNEPPPDTNSQDSSHDEQQDDSPPTSNPAPSPRPAAPPLSGSRLNPGPPTQPSPSPSRSAPQNPDNLLSGAMPRDQENGPTDQDEQAGEERIPRIRPIGDPVDSVTAQMDPSFKDIDPNHLDDRILGLDVDIDEPIEIDGNTVVEGPQEDGHESATDDVTSETAESEDSSSEHAAATMFYVVVGLSAALVVAFCLIWGVRKYVLRPTQNFEHKFDRHNILVERSHSRSLGKGGSHSTTDAPWSNRIGHGPTRLPPKF